MGWRHVIPRRLRALLFGAEARREMSEELRLHYELAVEAKVRDGMEPRRARAQVLQEFGGADGAREMYRDARGAVWLERIGQDLRYAARTLAATPGLTAIIVVTLALGIGANSAVFSVVHGVLLRELPYESPDRIVVVWENDRASGTEREPASVPDFFDFRERARSLASLAAFRTVPMNRTGDGTPERVPAARVSRDFLRTLGVTPILGRDFLAAEAEPGGPAAVLISSRYWHSRFAGDPAVLGSTLRLDDSLFTVVGILPPRFHFPDASVELWAIEQLVPSSGPRWRHGTNVIGRLSADAGVESAQREMDAIARALEEEYPQSNTSRGVFVEPIEQVIVGSVRSALLLVMGAVGVVLLIACVNATNLLLARRAARASEIAVRTALGASRGRIVQQLVVESALIAGMGAALGVALAWLGVRALVAAAPSALPRAEDIAIDGTVLAFTLGVSVAVAIVFGLLPAAGSTQVAPARTLSSGGGRTGSSSREQTRLRGALVVAEIAMAVLLVTGAGLLLRSFWTLRGVDTGIEPANILAVDYQLPASRYPRSFADYPAGWERTFAFQREVLERIAAIPGVRRAALAFNDPLSPGFTNSFVIEGRDAPDGDQPEVPTRPVSAEYFATAGIPLLSGRAFSDADDARSPPVLLINRAMAERYFPDESPLGRRIRFWGQSRRIIGVVGNERFGGLAEEPPPAVYPPITQAPATTGTLLVRTSVEPRSVLPAIRAAIWSIDPDLAPYGVRTMGEVLDGSLARQRFLAALLACFAGLALVLALVGVYGVIAYAVTQRRREIGIRLALGASARRVLRNVVGEGLRLAAAGTAIGILLALGAARFVRSQLHEISPTDPVTLAVAAAVLLAVAVAGSAVPAWRAAKTPPGDVMRAS